jgi:hypothetical protein
MTMANHAIYVKRLRTEIEAQAGRLVNRTRSAKKSVLLPQRPARIAIMCFQLRAARRKSCGVPGAWVD